jgi:hypothetical protein
VAGNRSLPNAIERGLGQTPDVDLHGRGFSSKLKTAKTAARLNSITLSAAEFVYLSKTFAKPVSIDLRDLFY